MTRPAWIGLRPARSAAILTLVWVLSLLYVRSFVDRGWVPHDEGMLAQNAERALRGELPHRDFDESYTGALTQMHALAFRLFGVRLLSLRLALFGFFLFFVPPFFGIARRLLSPWPAGLLTLVAVAWSFPNYFASMPSWYVLLFSMIGTYTLLRYLETPRWRWLFFAGLCGGLSVVTHLVGLYYVAAVLLWLAFREQTEAERLGTSDGRMPAFFFFQAGMAGVFVLFLLWLLRRRLAPMELIQLLVPPLAVTGIVLRRAWLGRRRETSGARFQALSRITLPFLLGALVPIAVFFVSYLVSGALPDLVRGLFRLPFRQIAAAKMAFPSFSTIAAALPYLFLLAISVGGTRRIRPAGVVTLALFLALLLLASFRAEVYRLIWHSARSLGVVAVLVGCWWLARRAGPEASPPRKEEETFLLLAMIAVPGLIQFPYAAPIYFCYTAPLVALALASVARNGWLVPHGVVAAFYLAFALWRLNPGYIWKMGIAAEPYGPLAVLDAPRGGIRVPQSDRAMYEALISSVQRQARGPFVYAAPDCPEVCFLTERLNPTQVVFDYLRDPEPAEKLRQRLEAKDVQVAVINERPDYSAPIPSSHRAVLEAMFPNEERIGKFVVRWRGAGDTRR